MIVYFNTETGNVSDFYIRGEHIKKIYLKNNKYLKSTILQVGINTYCYFPQIVKNLSLNIFPLEKYYQNINNQLKMIDIENLNFPKECRY